MGKLWLSGTVVLIGLAVAGCTTRQATGVAVGATAGAVVGGPVGAVAGAGVGALATGVPPQRVATAPVRAVKVVTRKRKR